MTKENALEALENMRADVVDFGDLIEGSTCSSVDDYELLKQFLDRAKKVEKELKYTKEQFDKYWKEVCILKPRLAKVEDLILFYLDYCFHNSCLLWLELLKYFGL